MDRDTTLQRERKFITLLDEKLESIKSDWVDELHYDRGLAGDSCRNRTVGWRLGPTEFHFTYREVEGVKGSAVFRIRHQPAQEGKVGSDWEDLNSFGELDASLRAAKKAKGYTRGDRKAQKGTNKHAGPSPQGLILAGLTGSLAYNLEHDGYVDPVTGNQVAPSDVDTRGVFIASTNEIVSLIHGKKFIEDVKNDTKFDEVGRFMQLCMTCNPERLEMLATSRKNGTIITVPFSAMQDPTLAPSRTQRKSLAGPDGQLIVDNQHLFLSKKVVKTYGGYARSQLYRIERKEDRSTKPMMHLVRLMITGIGILKEGVVDCDMTAYRDEMLAIRMGQMSWDEVSAWHQRLEVEFAKAADETALPDEPDIAKLDEILLEFRRTNWV